MPIAFDTNTTLQAATGTLTFSHTCTGSNLILFVAATTNTPNSVTGITYNGVAMTKITTTTVTGNVEMSLWYLISPTTGAHNVVVSSSGVSPTVHAFSASYTGAKQSGQPDASGTAGPTSTTSFSQSLTSVANNSWAIWFGFTGSASANTAGTNTTQRTQDTTAVGLFLADTNGAKTPAGTDTMNMSTSPAVSWQTIMATFAPSSNSFTQTLTESATITDALQKAPARSLAESTTITDTLSIGRLFTKILTELATITDTLARSITRLLTESATMTQTFARSIIRTFTESLTITDTFARLSTFIITFVETFSVTDTLRKALNRITDLFSDKFSSRSSSWGDKFSKRNTSASDKFSSRGNSYNDKFTHL